MEGHVEMLGDFRLTFAGSAASDAQITPELAVVGEALWTLGAWYESSVRCPTI
jgi:hypothetical protein